LPLLFEWQFGNREFIQLILSLCCRRQNMQQPALEWLAIEVMKRFGSNIRVRILDKNEAFTFTRSIDWQMDLWSWISIE
jgi:hypothetical protein